MIQCLTCQYENPEGATLCEACYSALPATIPCPKCGVATLENFSFCGNCGFNLQQTLFPDEPPAMDAGVPVPLSTVPETPSPERQYPAGNPKTQIQLQLGRLIHQQSNMLFELPAHLAAIYIGKPGGNTPPDIDVSGFPQSEVVSRVHARVAVEGNSFYLEDLGSTNGTYVNHTPLAAGQRQRLSSGDRIALGKGDLLTFVFVLES